MEGSPETDGRAQVPQVQEDGKCGAADAAAAEPLEPAEASQSEPEQEGDRGGDLEAAEALKQEGNALYKAKDFDAALERYSSALEVAPPDAQQRAVYYANSGACLLAQGKFRECADCCSHALEIDVSYMRALHRRMAAHEALDDLSNALADAKKIVDLEPGDHATRAKIEKWEPEVAARNEKMKDEVLGKLKDLGNSVLGRFGMSLDNFKMQQDPNTGGYSINYSPPS